MLSEAIYSKKKTASWTFASFKGDTNIKLKIFSRSKFVVEMPQIWTFASAFNLTQSQFQNSSTQYLRQIFLPQSLFYHVEICVNFHFDVNSKFKKISLPLWRNCSASNFIFIKPDLV